jgi:hypothetical protein
MLRTRKALTKIVVHCDFGAKGLDMGIISIVPSSPNFAEVVKWVRTWTCDYEFAKKATFVVDDPRVEIRVSSQ